MTRDQVLAALKGVNDPAGGDIVSSGTMRALNVDGETVRFVLEIDPTRAPAFEAVKAEAEAALAAIGATANIVMTAHSAPAAPPELKPRAATPS